ncbi:uncharacterized protein RHOBADRAFT_44459 [Rhodotorula graminis WP1]|uniref:Dicer-like protein 1 n=1 Tax=Rhodotorula graminis (strain WP1) TaxID=578459 RepID=A0A194S360_RHOGW|nr:uncharacterized protein RHOBADRAFT_44459 [Rhodotorula graminis WP1]KPV74940.1 hypothetical protein RHOBADRAFT_44459 [Rhodotorula graminis WP1]
MAPQPPPGGAPSATRHCQPVQSALSAPVNHPPRDTTTTTQSRPLTSAQVGPPPVPPQVAAAAKQKKRQAQRDAKELVPAGDEGTRGRIVVPGSSSTIAAATPATVTKSARQKKGRKKKAGGLPSQASQFNKSKAGPSSSSTTSKSTSSTSTSPSFAPVRGQGSALAFTRPRGDALNSSIASVLGAPAPDSVLGTRPADVLEAHDRETRTKRQKVAADEMRRRLLLDDDGDDDDDDEPGKAVASEDKPAPVAVPPALVGEDDDDDGDLVIAPAASAAASFASPSTIASGAAPGQSGSPTTDPLANYRTLPSFAPRPSAFVFPPAPPTHEAPKPSFPLSFDLPPAPPRALPPPPPPRALEPVVESVQPDVEQEQPVVDDVAPEPPASPVAVAVTAAFEDEPMPGAAPVGAPSTSVDALAKALSLPVGAVPKPDLRSAAIILAGKKRKPKKFKRAPQLFDYLSDEQSDDWEDVQQAKVPKRPKTGRAVGGKLESGGETTAGEGHGEVDVDGDEEREKKALAEKLVPTSYQKALLECAQQANIVTVLQTGSGKTLVGVLLIDWVHAIEAQRREAGEPPRLSFFLTNSVPLVHQQADTIARNTKLRVGKLFGALGVNLCSEKEWDWNFAHFDCLVVTAQLILDSLAHGFLKMEQISLLVLDEVHHSKANHPFASILRDFYHRAPKHKRPRILGLTASPLNGNAGIDEAKTLEKLLDAKLVTAPPETQAELRAMASVPTVLQIEYDAPPTYARTELFDQVVSKIIVRDETFDRYYAGAKTMLNDYGPDAADLVWHLALERCRQKLLPLHESDGSASEVEDAFLGLEMEVGPLDDGARRAKEKQEERRRDKARMKKELREKAEREVSLELPDWLKVIEAHKPTLDVERFSPKLRMLIAVLKACKDGAEAFRGIIFVNRRLDALVFAQIIRELAKVDEDLAWINVDCVTGHGTAASNSLGPRMSWHEQADVLSSFAEGRTNLLLATSVVEEGLDVQPCNFCVRFDLYDTHISYVQSRGRARASGSHYLVFLERGNVEHKRKLLRIALFDKEVAGLLSREIYEAEDQDGDDLFGRADETSVYIEEPTTGALLTPHFALSLLVRYCGSLPKSDEFSLHKPRYTVNDYGRNEYGARQFSCTVQLPSASKVRVVTGGLRETPKLAKRQAAYTACVVLRNSGCLDEHLLPPRFLPPDDVVDVVTGVVVAPKKRQVEYEHKLADSFLPVEPCADVTTLHASLLHFGGDQGEAVHAGQRYRPVVLLTRNRLPVVPPMTMFVAGEALLVYSTAIGAIDVTVEQRKALTGYTLQLWQAILNKVLRVAREEVDGKETRKELDLVYFVGVLRDGVNLKATGVDSGDLDWAAMERGPKLPPGRQSAAGFATLMDYYLSFDEGFFHTVKIKDEQPLLEVSRMPKTVTHLTRTPRNDVQPTIKKLLHSTTRFAIPQIALVHFLPASIFRTAYMLPSIVHDLEQRCLVVELNERLFEAKLDHELVRTALMTPSASIGLDYNRLELLGDAFLKYMASTACFVTHDRTTHEGTLHRARLEQINNSRLADSGKATNLPAYLASRPFTSRQFLPPNILQLSPGPAPPTSAVIGDKTIADCVEALLGAGMETGYEALDGGGIHKGFDLALEVAKALGLELGNVTVWDDFARLYGPPGEEAPVVGALKAVEAALGYKFKHASLVTEALTHPSKLDSVSFERCEWLGDSVLDFCVLRQCWKKWGGELSEGHLTELKGACVSNETLAALAIELDLDKFLAHSSDGLALNMRLYRERIVLAHDQELVAAVAEQRPMRPYWLALDPPKAVADLTESLFGAVYLDSRFDPGAVQRVFDHCVAPWLARWISPTTIKVDAVRNLLEHAQAGGCHDVSHVSAVLEPRIDHRTGELIQRLTRTSVVAHGMVLSTVESGNPKTAKRLSSADALAYLDANPGFFPTVCDCATRRDIARELALEELERLRAEGLLDEPESSDDEQEAAEQRSAARARRTTAGASEVEAGEGEAMAVDA